MGAPAPRSRDARRRADLQAPRGFCLWPSATTAHDLTGFVYLPHKGGSNGRIADYELLGSSDGAAFRRLAAGTFGNIANNPTARTVRFDAPAAGVRHVRLVTRREANGQPWASVAELSVLVK